jgi:hypothetical protein
MKALVELEVLRARLERKDCMIERLQDQIRQLGPQPLPSSSLPSSSLPSTLVFSPALPSRINTPSTCWPPSVDEISSSSSLSIQVPASDDDIFSNVQSSYAEALLTPTPVPPPERRTRVPPPSTGQVRLNSLETKHRLRIVYILGVAQCKIGGFRRTAKVLGLSLQHVCNISFIGQSTVELLVESHSAQSFIDEAKAVGYTPRTDIDITSNHILKLLESPLPSVPLSQLIKTSFIRRVSHEIKTCPNDRVKSYYLDWAQMLEWKDGLSTPAVSK